MKERAGAINPETKKFKRWPIPGGGGTVRNVEIDRKTGDIWLAESGVGKDLARANQTDRLNSIAYPRRSLTYEKTKKN